LEVDLINALKSDVPLFYAEILELVEEFFQPGTGSQDRTSVATPQEILSQMALDCHRL